MYSSKSIYTLLAAFIVIIGFISLRDWLDSRTNQDLDSFSQYTQEINADSINQISLSKDSDVLEVTKADDETWQVAGLRAESSMITELLSTFSQPSSISLVAETESRHQSLGVDETGMVLEFMAGEQSWEFIIGNRSANGHYVRPSETDEVFLLPVLPINSTQIAVSDWVDLSLSRIPRDTIESLTINHDNSDLTLNQEEGEWYLAGNSQPIETISLTSVLSLLESFRANRITLEDDTSDYPVNPQTTITASIVDQDDLILSLFEGENDVLVESNQRQGSFIITTSTAKDLQLTRDNLTFKEE